MKALHFQAVDPPFSGPFFVIILSNDLGSRHLEGLSLTVNRLLVTLLLIGIIGVTFTQAVTTATETALKDEQEENRRALFDHAGNQLRNWATMVLAFIVAIFTALRLLERTENRTETRQRWSRISRMTIRLLIVVLLVQCLYSFTRVLWYTQFSAVVLYAPERPLKDLEVPKGWPLERPWEPTPIYRLIKSADELAQCKLANFTGPGLADWIYWIGSDPWGWLLFTAEPTAAAFVSLVLLEIAGWKKPKFYSRILAITRC